MSKKKLTIDDLPTMEQITEQQVRRQLALSKRTPDAERILYEKTAMTYSFLFQNYNLVETQDQNLITSVSRKLGQLGFLSVVLPTICNIGLAKFTRGHIFSLPKILRVGIRLGIYAVPITMFAEYARNSYQRVSLYMVDKYMDRIELFMKFGDPKIMNPDFESGEEPQNSLG